MASQTLLLDAALILATAVVYAYVGAVTWRRRTGGEARLASDLFATWWFALAATSLIGALRNALGYLGVRDVALYLTLGFVSLFGMCLALWGLLYYLVYLFSGRKRLLVPVTAFYALMYAWLVYLVARWPATGVEVGEWGVRVTYATEPGGALVTALVLLIIVPPVLGAAGYARLFFRVQDATQRYRIGLVSFTFAAWFMTSLLAYFLELRGTAEWQVASRAIALGAAALIYAAYRPPAWVRSRWGIRRVDEPEASA